MNAGQPKKTPELQPLQFGYADGYPRHAQYGTPVLIHGKTYPLAGRVSMDLITVDIGSTSQIKPGDEVILWGKELPVSDIAKKADTIAYDLVTGISRRVMKYFVT